MDGKEYVVLGFDDSQSDNVEIATDTLTGSSYNINKPEDIAILPALISWSYYSAGERAVTYKINRRDGAIVGSVHNWDGMYNDEDRDFTGYCDVAGTNIKF